MSINLYPHQETAVNKMHNGCVLYGDVGTGKSLTAMAYFVTHVAQGQFGKPYSMAQPKDVYVITTAKKRDSGDWTLEAAKFGIFTDQNKSIDNLRVHVDSWNNLAKYVGVKDAFFIFDEQRVVGYGAWSRAFIKIARVNEWILLSATPGDTWLDYIPVFIANGWYKHKTDFLDQHVIWTPRVKYPKVLRYQNVGALVRRRNEVLVHMPYKRHTVRHSVDIVCDYDQDKFEKAVKKRWHVYEKRPLRDVAELFGVMRKIVNSDSSRLDSLRSLMEKHPKLIVFYNFDYELEMLRTLDQSTHITPVAKYSSKPETQGRWTQDLGHGEMWIPGASTSRPQAGSDQKEASKCQTNQTSSRESKKEKGFQRLAPNSSKSSEVGSEKKSRKASLTETDELTKLNSMRGATDQHSHPSTHAHVTPGLLQNEIQQKRAQPASCSDASTTKDDMSVTSTQIGSNQKTDGNTSAVKATCESSDTLFSTEAALTVAEWNGHKHQEVPATERWLYLVQYRAGAEGWNCVETDAIVFWSQTYSYRDWFQAHGRIDRLNTTFVDLWYYHLISRSIIDKAIRAALRVKKSFNEKDLAL